MNADLWIGLIITCSVVLLIIFTMKPAESFDDPSDEYIGGESMDDNDDGLTVVNKGTYWQITRKN